MVLNVLWGDFVLCEDIARISERYRDIFASFCFRTVRTYATVTCARPPLSTSP